MKKWFVLSLTLAIASTCFAVDRIPGNTRRSQILASGVADASGTGGISISSTGCGMVATATTTTLTGFMTCRRILAIRAVSDNNESKP